MQGKARHRGGRLRRRTARRGLCQDNPIAPNLRTAYPDHDMLQLWQRRQTIFSRAVIMANPRESNLGVQKRHSTLHAPCNQICNRTPTATHCAGTRCRQERKETMIETRLPARHVFNAKGLNQTRVKQASALLDAAVLLQKQIPKQQHRADAGIATANTTSRGQCDSSLNTS